MERQLLQIAFGLSGLVAIGAWARLLAVVAHGMPTNGTLMSPAGELIVVPLPWLWQRHVAGAAGRIVIR
jgi:hypothetical protein